MMKQYLNAAEIARLQGVDKSTVCKWIKKGQFKNYFRPGGKGEYHIPLSSYEEWLRASHTK